MNPLRTFLNGLASVAFTSLIVLGSLSLAFAEGAAPITATPVTGPTQANASPSHPVSTNSARQKPTAVHLPTVTPLPFCQPPAGWAAYTVPVQDTLPNLAAQIQTEPEKLRQANCLVSDVLLPGSLLYIPPSLPTPVQIPSPTFIPCGPPPGWVLYLVQPGDNFYQLSLATNSPIYEILRANCRLGNIHLQAGEQIWMPFVPVYTPYPTYVPPTATVTIEIPTPTDTATLTTPQPTEPQPTATLTLEPTAESTASPTITWQWEPTGESSGQGMSEPTSSLSNPNGSGLSGSTPLP